MCGSTYGKNKYLNFYKIKQKNLILYLLWLLPFFLMLSSPFFMLYPFESGPRWLLCLCLLLRIQLVLLQNTQ